jgi:putative transposase
LEHGLKVEHSSINPWVIKYAPLLEKAFRKRHKCPVKGRWVCWYRAKLATRAFLRKQWVHVPDKVSIDKSGANKAGMDTINLKLALLFIMGGLFLQMNVRQAKYLNHMVEQDHRLIKKSLS